MKLNKSLWNRLEEALKEAESKTEHFERVLNESFESVQSAVNDFNDLVVEFNDARESISEEVTEVVGEIRAIYDDRSEKWQESETGEEADSIISEMEGYFAEELDEMDCPDYDYDAVNISTPVEEVVDQYQQLEDV